MKQQGNIGGGIGDQEIITFVLHSSNLLVNWITDLPQAPKLLEGNTGIPVSQWKHLIQLLCLNEADYSVNGN